MWKKLEKGKDVVVVAYQLLNGVGRNYNHLSALASPQPLDRGPLIISAYDEPVSPLLSWTVNLPYPTSNLNWLLVKKE